MKIWKKVQENEGSLFIAYKIDEQRIVSAWRNTPENEERTLRDFLIAQISRNDGSDVIPDIRFYQFNFKDMKKVPLLTADNSHLIPFVSNLKPKVNISLTEAMFFLAKEINPETEISGDSTLMDEYHSFVEELTEREDRLLWKNEIINEPQATDYDLLANLILKYEHQPAVTEEQIRLLNEEETALRIFYVLQEYFVQTDYILHGWDIDNFQHLIHVPIEERTPLHLIRAELFKVIDFKHEKYDTDTDLPKKVFELNIFLSCMNVDENWESQPIPEIWKKIACNCMTNTETTADAITSFQYVPDITEEQVNYLLQSGTTPETFVHSGIMGDVFTKTRLFKQKYGLFLEELRNTELTAIDNLIIDSLLLLATETWERSETSNTGSDEKDIAGKTIRSVHSFRQYCKEEKMKKAREKSMNQLTQALTTIKERIKDEFYTHEGLPYDEEYFQDIIRNNYQDIELSGQQCSLITSYLPGIPVEIARKTIPIFKGQEYGKLPEHQDLSLEGIMNAVTKYNLTPLHQLILHIEKQRLDESIHESEKENIEWQRQIQRLEKKITDNEASIEKKKHKRFEIKEIMKQVKTHTAKPQTQQQ